MKILNLGCGDLLMKDAVNLDVRSDLGAEVIHDLDVLPWPFKDEEFDYIFALDIIEHLDSVVAAVEEMHRILKPEGVLELRTSHMKSENSWIDPTHKWHLFPQSFNYFDPATSIGQKYHYYSKCKFTIFENKIDGQEIVIKMRKLKSKSKPKKQEE